MVIAADGLDTPVANDGTLAIGHKGGCGRGGNPLLQHSFPGDGVDLGVILQQIFEVGLLVLEEVEAFGVWHLHTGLLWCAHVGEDAEWGVLEAVLEVGFHPARHCCDTQVTVGDVLETGRP